MTIALWVAQGFAALVFLLTGALKVVTPKEKLAEKMHWAATWPPGSHQTARSRRGGGRARARAPRRAAHRARAHADRSGLPCRADARRRPDAPSSSRELRPGARARARLRRDHGGWASFWSVGGSDVDAAEDHAGGAAALRPPPIHGRRGARACPSTGRGARGGQGGGAGSINGDVK